MSIPLDALQAAHRHSSKHRDEIAASPVCGCFYCHAVFGPERIERWLAEGSGTALCPNCDIDSVIGSASGFPVDDPAFLSAMHAHWFERVVHVAN
jgi:hypothetical protein